MEGMFLSEFFEQGLSYSGHQMHDLMWLFHKKYNLNSKYQIFDYMVFLDKFKEINNMVFQLPYSHNHKYVEVPLQYQNLQF